MRAILIFDHLNDVLFAKYNKKFANHILKLAKMQGLLDDDKDTKDLENSIPSPNIIMQLFSPIVTSQHVMASQFGNSYTSMKFQDGTNMVFDEYIGYTFIYIATKEVELMRRTLGVCVSIVRHVCGPDIAILKTNWQKVCLVSSLLDAWSTLRNCEQSVLTEAVEQLSVNAEVASSVLKVLHDACDKLKSSQPEFSNLHVLLLVGSKFLSLYSSKNAHDLCASDILLMVLLCWVINNKRKHDRLESNDDSEDNDDDSDILLPESSASKSDETKLNFGAKLATPTSEDITNLFRGSRDSSVNEGFSSLTDDDLYSELLLLGYQHNYTANAVHIFELSDSINLITIVEATNISISSGLCDSFHYLNLINNLQFQQDLDELKPAFENLDIAIKKVLEGIKKNRSNVGNDVDMCQKRLQTKWDFVRKKYNDLLRSRDLEVVLQIEANISGFLETLKELLRLTCFDRNFLKQGIDVLTTVGRLVRQKLNDFSDFLKVKALKNFTLGSSLTINKYLEEFPGLVHFIYIDRTTHRLIAPTLDFTSTETLALTTKKIWNMVEQSRMHLQKGHLSVMWKDTTFNYSYFLWFEDNSSCSPPKCKVYLNYVMKIFPVPGILCGDYYRKLTETCFPKLSPSKVRIYELYCVHLGLTTSTCVLEHSRRLAATIWEVTGVPSNLADIF
ncbi:Hermansky-Pudlak syndrome 1 protein homolog isoform X1 [Nylanderia fulva]|uniref:Hermansky-Pudlak syndrome 1 protein homolog isoform X1 n=1 Tax=Nylanderia fulva TaxID=613905 RepID=UPI0010FBA794|nr:Hermansky-Pudlak syndrome 1 protein homolog isoform X1 [Nylanderia fulva]XP_029156976.1 Hermansky-Pudlak syndrome 1 protein homolog isoform X1 [Nylanderia fulva]XP_029156978.1 Hermansky-Pudlak syndrome 1 protein homolog isoform X1 [Nylanderia fulva]XP_029156979.1 Hermansky-Pudlak syndrome 1 protein homolog isoform X1 [Nylanderia fulva]